MLFQLWLLLLKTAGVTIYSGEARFAGLGTVQMQREGNRQVNSRRTEKKSEKFSAQHY